MATRSIVLRKGGHWYVVNSDEGDEREILLTILEYAEQQSYNITRDEVLDLIDRLGWELEIHDTLGLAS